MSTSTELDAIDAAVESIDDYDDRWARLDANRFPERRSLFRYVRESVRSGLLCGNNLFGGDCYGETRGEERTTRVCARCGALLCVPCNRGHCLACQFATMRALDLGCAHPDDFYRGAVHEDGYT